MEFGILGPLRVWGDAGPVALAGDRQRMVLALLVVHAGRLVSLGYLVDAAGLLYPHRLRLAAPHPATPPTPLPDGVSQPAHADEAAALAWLDAERANLVAAVT